MRKNRGKMLLRSALLLTGFTVLCGGIYTLLVTLLAQVFFPMAANGSLVYDGAQVAGSRLLGQPFQGAGHLWGRCIAEPSAQFRLADGEMVFYGQPGTAVIAERSYAERMRARAAALQERNGQTAAVPADLLTASASGLDPDISLAAARFQIPRLMRETGRSEAELEAVLQHSTENRFLGIFGEPRVNVLLVNRELDSGL